jgi:hypothetical protein
MLSMYAEDGVFDASAVFTDVAPVHGHDAMLRHWRDVWQVWGGLRLDPLEVFDVGAGRYAVDVRLWGKGKSSGVEVDQRFAFLYTIRLEDEKVTLAQLLPDVDTAIALAQSEEPQLR